MLFYVTKPHDLRKAWDGITNAAVTRVLNDLGFSCDSEELNGSENPLDKLEQLQSVEDAVTREEIREEQRQYTKEWRKKNREKWNNYQREYQRKWRAKNREKVAEYNQRYWEQQVKKRRKDDATLRQIVEDKRKTLNIENSEEV